jgi:hypothetical protein
VYGNRVNGPQHRYAGEPHATSGSEEQEEKTSIRAHQAIGEEAGSQYQAVEENRRADRQQAAAQERADEEAKEEVAVAVR